MSQFRKHTVDRRVRGGSSRGLPNAKKIDTTLVLDRGDGRRGTGGGKDSKRAVTRKVIEELGLFAAGNAGKTGRTHQVRIPPWRGRLRRYAAAEKIYDRPVKAQASAPDGSTANRPCSTPPASGSIHPESNANMTWDAKPPGD